MASHLRRELCDLVVHEAPDRLALLRVVKVRVENSDLAQREAEAAPLSRTRPPPCRAEAAQGQASSIVPSTLSPACASTVLPCQAGCLNVVREGTNRAMLGIRLNVLTASRTACRDGLRGKWRTNCPIRAQPAASGAKPASSSALHHRSPSTLPSSSRWAEAGWAVPSLRKRWQYAPPERAQADTHKPVRHTVAVLHTVKSRSRCKFAQPRSYTVRKCSLRKSPRQPGWCGRQSRHPCELQRERVLRVLGELPDHVRVVPARTDDGADRASMLDQNVQPGLGLSQGSIEFLS